MGSDESAHLVLMIELLMPVNHPRSRLSVENSLTLGIMKWVEYLSRKLERDR